MFLEKLVNNNALHILNPAVEGLADHRVGLVIARAGLGKTAILVQIAMDTMLRGRKVLHVSIGEGLEKTKVWYDDIFKYMTEGFRKELTMETVDELMRNRMIMTFKETTFSRPKLEERLNDLIYQNIFRPSCVIVDGLDFTNIKRSDLDDLKELAEAMNVQLWFSALSHRDDNRVSSTGIPAPCHELDDLVDTVILLQPHQGEVKLNFVKDSYSGIESGKTLKLDPSTMMVKAD